MSNKTVWCWGSNLLSQLGIGQGADAYKSNPTEVKIDNVIDIDLADNYSCALKSTGKIFCWGANDQGSLGTGKLSGFVYEPEEVISPNVFISISANGEHTCAIDDKKKIYCWGFNENFSCGLDGNTNKIVSSPQLISSISGVKKVVSGLEHTCALTETGSVFCWGTGTQGQLGTGVKEGSNHIPNLVKLLPTSFDIISGYDQLLAFVKDDTSPIKKDPWIWGAGESGQNFSWKTPEACQLSCDLYAPTRVKPGDSTSLFETPILGYKTFSIILGGLVANFGYNIDGRLGVGKKFNLSESYGGPIESLTSIVEIAPGDGHMCARQSTGKIFCWGQGSKGQLGNGDTAEQLNPVEVKWLAANHSTLSSWKPFSPDGQSTEVLCHLVKPASK